MDSVWCRLDLSVTDFVVVSTVNARCTVCGETSRSWSSSACLLISHLLSACINSSGTVHCV
jgi:hypothetical protein